MKVCFSGDGQGAIAAAVKEQMASRNHVARCVDDGPVVEPFVFVHDEYAAFADHQKSCDVAICTCGGMLIRHAEDVTPAEEERLRVGNYDIPREFTERHIAAMVRDGVRGLIIAVGSNAGWYGNVHAEGYAAYKTALRRYFELRRRRTKLHGIAMSCPGFGGVEGPFWDKVGGDETQRAGIMAGDRKPLTLEQAASTVMTIIALWQIGVVLADGLIVSTDYQ